MQIKYAGPGNCWDVYKGSVLVAQGLKYTAAWKVKAFGRNFFLHAFTI